MAVVFDDQGSRQIRSGVTTNKMYTAYFADACASATPQASVGVPQIKVISPANYERVSGTYTIEVQVTADNDMEKVEVSIDSRPFEEMTEAGSSYTYDWDTTTEDERSYKIEIKATDVFANEGTRTVTARVEHATVVDPLEISNLRHSPHDPLDTDTIRFSCEVFTNDAAIQSVTITICEDDVCNLPETMIDEGGGTYSFTGGPYTAGTDVSYDIEATDINDNSVKSQKIHLTIYDSGTEPPPDDDVDDDVSSDDDDDGGGIPLWAILLAVVVVLVVVIGIIAFVVTRRER
jgi:hypothetical protein